MLERRRRTTGLAALSLTALGAVAGMEGTAFPTIKEPRAAALGGGWLDDAAGERAVHFALNAREGDLGDTGHLNIKLADGAGGFWADVSSISIIGPERAVVSGEVRKATGAFAGCEAFQLEAEDDEQSGEGDRLSGGCDAGPRFEGVVADGNLRIEGTPEKPGQ